MEGASFYVNDHLGNTRIVFNRNTCSDPDFPFYVESALDYYPFGKILREYHAGQKEKYLTTQHERDGETGFDYRGARIYDSDLGRFLSLDPASIIYPSLSDFSYVNNNPVKYIDPTGKYFVGADGNKTAARVKKNGKIKVKNATKQIKRYVRLINKFGSQTSKDQFMAVAENKTRVNFRVVKERTERFSLKGLHQAHSSSGPLDWDSRKDETKGRFKGRVAYIKDDDGNFVYKEATITMFEGNIDKNYLKVHSIEHGDGSKITKKEGLVSVFTHEGFHDTDQKTINAIKTRQGGGKDSYPVETSAYGQNRKVLREIKENRSFIGRLFRGK